jgi:hypothetical protein
MAVPQVREPNVDALIHDGELTIDGTYLWHSSANKSWVKIDIPVENNKSASLRVVITASQIISDRYSIALLLNNAARIRGLDINGSHSNRHTNKEKWLGQSHYHRWTDLCHDRFAYSPTADVGKSIQDSLEYFCKEFGIQCSVRLADLPPTQMELVL